MSACERRVASRSAAPSRGPPRPTGPHAGHKCGLNTGHKCGLNTGNKCRLKTGHKCGLNSGHKCGLNTGHKCGLNTEHKYGLNTKHKCELNTGNKCRLKTGHKCGPNTQHKCGLNTGHKCGLNTGHKHRQRFWKRGRFLLVFLLSLMSVRGSWGGGGSGGAVSLGAQLVCAKTPGLTERQRALCRAAPAAMQAISEGLRMAYAECAFQMRGRRWNCSGVSDGKHFGHVISMATKEAAFTYAITSAGVTHALSAACARGDLPACACRRRAAPRRRSPPSSWEWDGRCPGGAGAEGEAEGEGGARLARRFLDARELERDARALMNLHNNRLGRKLVRGLGARSCRCHGVSGSCAARTCWRAPPSFRRLARALSDKYLHATQVTAVQRGTTLDGRVNLQLVVTKGRSQRAPRRASLVYLSASPAYCEPSAAHAARGTHQRLCNRTSRGEDGCSHMCCGRGYSTRRVVSHSQCRCRFQWCCKVHCDTCLTDTEQHICN